MLGLDTNVLARYYVREGGSADVQEKSGKTGSHTGDQHDRRIFPDMQPASGLVGECSTDLHGNTFTAGTSSKEMSDPGAEHYQRDKGQRNLVSFFLPGFEDQGHAL